MVSIYRVSGFALWFGGGSVGFAGGCNDSGSDHGTPPDQLNNF